MVCWVHFPIDWLDSLIPFLFQSHCSLYIICITPISDAQLARIFSPLVGCLFTLGITFFALQRLFNLWNFSYIFLDYFPCWSSVWKVPAYAHILKLFTYFSLSILKAISLISKSLNDFFSVCADKDLHCWSFCIDLPCLLRLFCASYGFKICVF